MHQLAMHKTTFMLNAAAAAAVAAAVAAGVDVSSGAICRWLKNFARFASVSKNWSLFVIMKIA